MFENSTKTENDDNRRYWILVLMVFLFVPAFWFVTSVLYPNSMNLTGADSVSYVTPGIKVADDICSSLPKPELFFFVAKEKFPTTDGASAVIMHYQSERGFEEIMPTFLVWLDANRFKADPNANLTFIRGDQTVIIRRNDAVSPNYEIYCSAKEEKEIISFGI